ncbi:DUF4097 family beta strand repeat-containing protein [Actinosynnema sp. CS-041913]|uniref:DUF4097 family beta strand repeat-containing protein n=1 Tax=Actinosynnema sp. CS-041913 TaxID=3239917 RepID=UPI003D8D17E5
MPEGAVVVKRIALAAVAAVAVAGALSSCVRLVQNSFNDRHEVTETVSTVRLQNGSGNVVLRSRDGASGTEVKRNVEYPKDADKPTGVTHRVEGDTLVLDGCGSRCSVNYEVTVPTKDVKVLGDNSSGDVTLDGVASVEISVGSGNATVRNVAGVVRVDNSSGDVTASDIGGEFNGKVGSGDIRLSKMRGAVLVDNNSGNIDVEMGVVQSVRAEAGSGNVNVRVPKGAYRVEVEAGSGDKTIDVKSDPGASVELILRSNSGDLTLRAV